MVDFLARTRRLATYTVTSCEVFEAPEMTNEAECYENATRASASMLCMAMAWIDRWHMSWGHLQVSNLGNSPEPKGETKPTSFLRAENLLSHRGMVRERPRAIWLLFRSPFPVPPNSPLGGT